MLQDSKYLHLKHIDDFNFLVLNDTCVTAVPTVKMEES